MVVAQGDVFWADLPTPSGTEPGFRRPVVVVQGDALNRTTIRTVLCIPLTRNLRRGAAIGNVVLAAKATGLPSESVANVSQIFPANRSALEDRVGHLDARDLERLLRGLDVILGR